MLLPVKIASTGIYRPQNTQDAADYDRAQNWPDGTSENMGGVKSRQKANEMETVSMMGAEALLAAADGNLHRIDRLVCTSIIPEQPIPTTAALIAKRLGMQSGIAAYDVNASCIGYLLAIEATATAMACGLSKCAAIVAVERATLGLDENDKATAFLFGDGAASTILTPSNGESGILAIKSILYPQGAELCEIRAGGSRWNVMNPPPSPKDYLFRMERHSLAKLAMNRLPGFMESVINDAGVTLSDISCIIPHQASSLGLKFLRKWLDSRGPAMVDIICDHGNQVTVSLPTALGHAIQHGMLKRGDLGMMVGTAAGFGMGCMIFRY